MKAYYPKITFGVIVLNGEPFTKYCIEQVYKFAHQIIIVEGACLAAKDIATDDGHSTDGTLSILYDLKKRIDTDNKIKIITAEDRGYPNGFWPGEKTEQSAVYTEYATGDYIWQLDIDEFYKPADIKFILSLLANDPEISHVMIKQIPFWGNFNFYMDGWYFKGTKNWSPQNRFPRIFKWEKGYKYIEHRPPTIINNDGIEVRNIKAIDLDKIKKGIFIYHYFSVFENQVLDKLSYYSNAKWKTSNVSVEFDKNKLNIGKEIIKKPFRLHYVKKFPSWIDKFIYEHPPEIKKLIKNLTTNEKIKILVSENDLEKLNSSFYYIIGRLVYKYLYLLQTKSRYFVLRLAKVFR
jgi:hypothetical protein